MKSIFTHIHKRSSKELLFAARMTGATAVLVFAAVLIGVGGPAKLSGLLAQSGVLPQALTGCAYFSACNTTAYETEMLIPLNTSNVVTNTFLTGQTAYFHWVAGAYGANHYSIVCDGTNSGWPYACGVTLGSPQYSWPSCQSPTFVCTVSHTQCDSYDKWGNCTSSHTVCDSGYTAYDTVNCGNANYYFGTACFASDGVTVVGSEPSCQWGSGPSNGYNGSYPFSTLAMTLPSTAGTYTYWFSSYYLNHANQFNSNLANMSPISVTINVIDCNTSGFSSPWNTNSYLVYPGGKGTVNNWEGRFCIRNLSSNYVYVPMATQAEWDNFKAAASGLSVNVFSY